MKLNINVKHDFYLSICNHTSVTYSYHLLLNDYYSKYDLCDIRRS